MKLLRLARVALSALAAAAIASGCAAVLGLDETTLRPGSDAGPSGGGGSGGSGDGGPMAGPGGGSPQPDLTLSASPERVHLVRGASAEVTLTLSRAAGAAIAVALAPLPNGVTGGKGTIPVGADQVTVTVAASKDAPLGLITPSVQATGAADLPLPILVGDAAGTLDTTWSSDGVVLEPVGGKNPAFFAVIAQPDGRIVAGGVDGIGGWVIRRYQADGGPDAPFDTNAAAAMPTSGQLRGLAIDPKGNRIIAVGSSNANTTAEATIVRLNADGTPDAVFGNSGVKRFDTVNYPDGSAALGAVVQPDSAIVVVGTVRQGPDDVAMVTRLDPSSGQEQGTFARYRASGKSSLSSVALDGTSIVAGGADRAASPPRSLLVRLDGLGAPDKAFGSGGVASFNDGCAATSMAKQPGGGFVLVGQDVFGPNFCVGRATPAGALDWHLSLGGGTSETFTSVAALPDDRVVMVGHGGGTYDKYAEVVRLLPQGGAPDTAFAPKGTVTFEDPNTPDAFVYRFNAVALDADGRILVAGSKSPDSYVLLRLWP